MKCINEQNINVQGKLTADGTTDEPIVFTHLYDDEYGGDTNTDGTTTIAISTYWRSLVFKATSGTSSSLSHCKFRYGGENNGFVYCDGGSPTITNCHFYKGEKGLVIRYNSLPIVENNVFEQHILAPIRQDWNVSINLPSNTFINNGINGIELFGTGDNVPLSILAPTGIADMPYVISAGFLGHTSTLVIQPGVIIKHLGDEDEISINIIGKILAEGTPEQPIVFTSLYDDEYGGDTNNDGTATSGAHQQWRGINLSNSPSDSSRFINCLFRFGGYENEAALKVTKPAPPYPTAIFLSAI